MEETYDAIVLGTGLKECILSGLLSVNRFKVLHIDKNDYYGGESASLNLEQLYERFKPETAPPTSLGRARDWYFDLVPKFIMGKGLLVDVLRHTEVDKYMDLKRVDGSFVLRTKDESINKVPTTTGEVLSSKLCGLLEKKHMKKILDFISDVTREEHPAELETLPMRELYARFKITEEVSDFMGHAMALWLDDSYLDQPALETCLRIRDYCVAVSMFSSSPYIYPLYGLGELPQAFARLAAIWGGTYMLRTPIDEILYDENNLVRGIRSGEQKAYCKWLIMDPTYFPEMSKPVATVSRGIFILKGPLEECVKQLKTDKAGRKPTSAQIIINAKQCGRKSDVYVTTQGAGHKVVPRDSECCIGFVSAMSEMKTAEEDLAAGVRILERAHILERFVFRADITEPDPQWAARNVFISKGYDATSHFETTVQDVLEMYERVTGTKIDLKAKPRAPEAVEGHE